LFDYIEVFYNQRRQPGRIRRCGSDWSQWQAGEAL